MSEIIETRIDGSKAHPRVVEMDAEAIARIIMRTAHVREKLAIKTANEISDYIIACMMNNKAVQ